MEGSEPPVSNHWACCSWKGTT